MVRWLRTHLHHVVLAIGVIAYIATFSYLSVLRHSTFSSNYDLANMDQTIWNTLHGHFFSLTAETSLVSRLSVHADFLLILLSPLYLLWDNVRMLLIFQSVAIGLGAVPTFLLAYKVLRSRWGAVAVAFTYLLNPGLQWTNMYDFHAVSIAMPLIITAFYAAYTRKWTLFLWTAFLAILTKEQISLIVAMLGLYVAFIQKERKIGLSIASVGFIWFLLMVFAVIPYFSPDGKHWAWQWYSNDTVDQSQMAQVQGVSTEVFSTQWKNLTDWKIVIPYYVMLLKPFGFIPLIGLPWLLIVSPDILINSVSIHDQMRSYQLHYDSGILPGLIIAAIFGLAIVQKGIYYVNCYYDYSKHIFKLAVIFMFVFALRYNYYYSPLPISPNCWCQTYTLTKEDMDFEKALEAIPRDAVTTASPEVRAHTTHRTYAYTLPVATESADFIAVITQNRLTGDNSPKGYELELITQLDGSKTHKTVFKSEHFYLFQLQKK